MKDRARKGTISWQSFWTLHYIFFSGGSDCFILVVFCGYLSGCLRFWLSAWLLTLLYLVSISRLPRATDAFPAIASAATINTATAPAPTIKFSYVWLVPVVICLAATCGLLTLTGRDTGSVCRHTCAHEHAHRGGRLGARTRGSTGVLHCGGTSFVTPAVWHAGSDFVAGCRGTRGRVGVDVAVPVVAAAACTGTHTHRAVRRLASRILTSLECSLYRYLPSDVFAVTQVIASSRRTAR